MELIVGSRQSGKTTKLIEYAHKNDFQIVCEDRRACGNLSDLAFKLNIKIRYPMSFDEFVNQEFFGYHLRGIVIDNADKLLQFISPNLPVFGVTFNIEDSDE